MIEPTIDRRELFKALKYAPHSVDQWDAHESHARFKIPCCGRRWGKTTFAANEMTFQMFRPDSYFWIVAPSYAVGEKEFRIIHKNFVARLPQFKGMKGFRVTNNVKQGDMRIELPWGTVLEVKSADRPDSLLGEGLDGVIFSEAATHSVRTWEMYIEPALLDKNGFAIFPSTPRGYNWYEGLWRLGQIPGQELYKSWRFPSWTNKAIFPLGEQDPNIIRIKEKTPKPVFDQEYGAKFTAFEGQIYEDFDPTFHVVDEIMYNPMWNNYQAFDFGFVDPFVCLDIMVDIMDNVYVWREYMLSGKTTWAHGQYLFNPANPDGYRINPPGYHVDGRYADPRGADEIATLQSMCGSIEAPAVSWLDGITTIQRFLMLQSDGKPKIFFSRRGCPNLIRQFEQLRHKSVKEGQNVKNEGQHDYDDHGPDALRYFFGPHFFLRLNAHLSDVYGGTAPVTENDSFFQLHQGFVRNL